MKKWYEVEKEDGQYKLVKFTQAGIGMHIVRELVSTSISKEVQENAAEILNSIANL